jgi:hypothetical protein
MLAILAPHVPLAYLTARFAIARARRGDVPDWRGILQWLESIANVLPRARDRFSSPARAQEWFEWRQHGRSLPAMVAILLPFQLSLLFVFSETPAIVFETLADVLMTPIFMAVFVAATVSKSNPYASDSHGVTPLLATRPMTSVSLIAAKLKVTIRSTVATWMLVIVAIPLAVRLSGTWTIVIGWMRQFVQVVGTPRAIAIALLGFSALVASTWKQLVSSLCIGMSGREWIVKASVFLALSFLAVIVPLTHWITRNNEAMAVLWRAFPWFLAVLVCLKILAAAWIAIRLHDSGLLSVRTLIGGAVCWNVFVFALYALLAWIVPELLIRHYVFALVAILEVPLARLSAAPLALAWNRHR